MSKKFDFGSFLSKLADTKNPLNAGAVDQLKKKLEAEKAQEIETELRNVYRSIQIFVAEIRSLRQKERRCIAEIRKLEESANKIVSGKNDE